MLQAGSKLKGRYEIQSVLGEGGMGFVYLALDHVLGGKKVAVKEMAVHIHREDEKQKALRQFRDEAHLLASLEHPRLVPVSDFFEDDENAYLVMAYIDGQTLATAITERAVPMAEVADWVDQICEVLEYLHDHDPPVLFRDLKPSNVMIDRRGQVRLIDFGISRTLEAGQSTSTFLKGAGTAEFAPVEQFGGKGTDARSDIYSLGATMFNLFTGEYPPISVDVISGEAGPADPRAMNPAIPPDLDAIIRKAMSLRKEDRYQTVRDLRLALAALPRHELAQTGSAAALPLPNVPTVPPSAPRGEATMRGPAPGGATLHKQSAGGATAVVEAPAAAAAAVAAPVAASAPPPTAAAGGSSRALAALLMLVILVGGGWLASRWYFVEARLRVESDPDKAQVLLDGKDCGTTPVTLEGLHRGVHTLVVQKDGREPQPVTFSVDGTGVKVRAGFSGKVDHSLRTLPRLQLTLAALQGSLAVSVNPSGAMLWVDGQKVKPVMTGSVVPVPIGRHKLKLTAEGYTPQELDVEVAVRIPTPVVVTLVSSRASVLVQTTPAGARILVDGALQPMLTPTTIQMAVGKHRVVLSKAGYEDARMDIEVKGGGNHTVSSDLKPLPQAAAQPRGVPTTDVPAPAVVRQDGSTQTTPPAQPTPTPAAAPTAEPVSAPAEGVAVPPPDEKILERSPDGENEGEGMHSKMVNALKWSRLGHKGQVLASFRYHMTKQNMSNMEMRLARIDAILLEAMSLRPMQFATHKHAMADRLMHAAATP